MKSKKFTRYLQNILSAAINLGLFSSLRVHLEMCEGISCHYNYQFLALSTLGPRMQILSNMWNSMTEQIIALPQMSTVSFFRNMQATLKCFGKHFQELYKIIPVLNYAVKHIYVQYYKGPSYLNMYYMQLIPLQILLPFIDEFSFRELCQHHIAIVKAFFWLKVYRFKCRYITQICVPEDPL